LIYKKKVFYWYDQCWNIIFIGRTKSSGGTPGKGARYTSKSDESTMTGPPAVNEKASRNVKRSPRKSTSEAFSRLDLKADSVVSVEAAQAVTSAIAAGRLRPGDKLPPERELSAILGISRASLRDALKMLSGMGVVQIRRSDGVFVSGHEEQSAAARRKDNALLLQRGSTAELFELREVLETQAAGWAAVRASAGDLEQMQELHAELQSKAQQGLLTSIEARRFDSKLHRLIARSTGNSVLLQVMDNLRGLLDESRDHTTVVPGRMTMSIEEIGRVIDAIRQRNPARAQQEMFTHLKMGEQANMLGAAQLVGRIHESGPWVPPSPPTEK
jgi:GntR family transcriptional repressor for pyruvate dehydrogenase complex